MEDEVLDLVKSLDSELKGFVAKSNEEAQTQAKLGRETTQTMKTLEEKAQEMNDRLLDIEQKASTGLGQPQEKVLTAGEEFVKSDQLQSMRDGHSKTARLEVKSTVTGSDSTVAPDRQAGIVAGASRRLRLEALLPSGGTNSNAIEFTKETTFVNNAAEVAEAGAKPETDITFDLVSMPVSTVAHWIKLSKQVMDDAPMLASYIDGRMRYGLDRRVDSQLLLGNGTGANISGLLNAGNHTAFVPTVGDNIIQAVRRAMTQVSNNDYFASAVVLNPADVEALDLVEGTDEHFVASNPRLASQPTIWGLPIIETNAIGAGNFLVGDFEIGAQVWNRQGTVVDLSESDGSNFTQNLVTLRAERRLALTTFLPAAFVGGSIA